MGLSASVKIEKGKSAFRYFHNRAVQLYPSNYKTTEAAAQATISKIEPRFFEFLGNAVSDIPETEIRRRMEAICDVNRGTLPKRLSDFLRPFSDPSKLEITWSERLVMYSGAVFEGISETAVQVGQGAANTLKTTGFLLPFAIAGGVLLLIYSKGKAAL